MKDWTPRIGDIVTRTGNDRHEVLGLYEGCDEIVIREIVDPDSDDFPGDIIDVCYFDVQFVERPENLEPWKKAGML